MKFKERIHKFDDPTPLHTCDTVGCVTGNRIPMSGLRLLSYRITQTETVSKSFDLNKFCVMIVVNNISYGDLSSYFSVSSYFTFATSLLGTSEKIGLNPFGDEEKYGVKGVDNFFTQSILSEITGKVQTVRFLRDNEECNGIRPSSSSWRPN